MLRHLVPLLVLALALPATSAALGTNLAAPTAPTVPGTPTVATPTTPGDGSPTAPTAPSPEVKTASPLPTPAVNARAGFVAAGGQFMVGFHGDAASVLLDAIGAHVISIDPGAGFALVDHADPTMIQSLADVFTGIAYVEENGPTGIDAASWDAASWDAASWDAASWDAASWDASTWDAASWDAASWDAASWDAASWDATSWDKSTMDPGFATEWHLGAIHTTDAWRTSTGQGVTICVVDSGIDATHPDLAASVKRTGGSFGYDFVNSDNDPTDDGGHGTAMAGIAAGVIANAKGLAGVSRANLVAAKVINATGSGTEANLALGIRWCVDSGGAKVILLALHTDKDNSGVRDAVKYAKSKGALLVAAAGNDGNVCDSCVRFPAAYPESIAVGAVAPNGTRAPFSDGGSKLSLVAPGVRIPAPAPGPRYVIGSGTSQASAVTAGAAAIVWAAKTSATSAQVKNALVTGAKDAGPRGFDSAYGNGYLRVDRALTAILSPDQGQN